MEASLINRTVTAVLQHTQTWGMVWFGLIFWGSVINALALRLAPDADSVLVAWAAIATGLALGALAKARGRWL